MMPSSPFEYPRVGLIPILAFAAFACALAWLVVLPLWFGDGLDEPWAKPVLGVMMFAPTAAALIVLWIWRPVPPGERMRFLGIVPLRPVKRTIGASGLAFLGAILVGVAVFALDVACRWVKPDFAHFSGYAQTLDDLRSVLGQGGSMPPIQVMVAITLVTIPLGGATINALLAFGEELGWRGFLVPALRRYGTWPALVLSGGIWGFWHTPIILLGYSFNRPNVIGVLLMIVAGILWGILFGWLRLCTGSIWPSVFAHGAVNAIGGLPMLLFAADTPFDPALTTVLGVSGCIVCATVIIVLCATRQFRPRTASRSGTAALPPL